VFPIVLSLLTAFCFASANLFAQRGLHLVPNPWGVWISLVVNSVFLLGLHGLFRPEASILVSANLLFVLIGLFVPGLTRILIFRGLRNMGSSVTSTVVNSTPMFSTILAVVFLSERPGFLILSGIGLIVGGLMTLSWGGEKRSWDRTELLYPLLASLFFAFKDVVARYGLGATGEPILAALITAVTATVEVFLIIRYVQGEKLNLPPLKVSLWFVASGLFTGGSFYFMFQALLIEEVSIVSPIVNSYSVFVLFLTPLIARRIENVTLRKILGAVVVVIGVFLISSGRN
jgi:drug/metabolite transporter (DMT)-like permease